MYYVVSYIYVILYHFILYHRLCCIICHIGSYVILYLRLCCIMCYNVSCVIMYHMLCSGWFQKIFNMNIFLIIPFLFFRIFMSIRKILNFRIDLIN